MKAPDSTGYLWLLVLGIFGSIWYQILFLFPQLELRVAEQITALKVDVATLQAKVTNLEGGRK